MFLFFYYFYLLIFLLFCSSLSQHSALFTNFQSFSINRSSHTYKKKKTEKSQKNRAQKKNKKKQNSKSFNFTQSLSLFSSLKPEKTARFDEIDFSQLQSDFGNANRQKIDSRNFRTDSGNIKTDSGNFRTDSGNFRTDLGNFSPHKILSSLQTTDAKPSGGLGETAYSFASPKPDLGDTSGGFGDYDRRPGAPKDLKAPVVEARFVVLSWKPPPRNSEDIVAYSVYYQQEGSER